MLVYNHERSSVGPPNAERLRFGSHVGTWEPSNNLKQNRALNAPDSVYESANGSLQVIRRLPMLADIQAFAFGFLTHAQANNGIDNLIGHQRD